MVTTATLSAGDVVTVDFPGATGLKRRPAVIVSTDAYHKQRPDVILGLITSNVTASSTDFDHILQDWSVAGLNVPSAFRSYFGMAIPAHIRKIGRLSDRDWSAIKACLVRALAT